MFKGLGGAGQGLRSLDDSLGQLRWKLRHAAPIQAHCPTALQSLALTTTHPHPYTRAPMTSPLPPPSLPSPSPCASPDPTPPPPPGPCRQVSVSELLLRHVAALEPLDALPHARAMWLFALSAALEKPLLPDVSAAFRSLLRRCCSLRAAASGPEDVSLPALNTIAVVAGGYFGQDQHLSALAATTGLDLA